MLRSLPLLVLLSTACAPTAPPAPTLACDRGEASSPSKQRAIVEDPEQSPALRASRLRALFAGDAVSSDAMSALLSVLTAEASPANPFPEELVSVAREISNRAAIEPRIRSRVAGLMALADQLGALPGEAERAWTLVGRIEDRAGRRFTVAPTYRPDRSSIAPMQGRFSESKRQHDEVYDAWLSCRRADPQAWEAVRLASGESPGLALQAVLDATAPESDAAKNALR